MTALKSRSKVAASDQFCIVPKDVREQWENKET
jgi:hypothetical protein